jgi:hypothetical protein
MRTRSKEPAIRNAFYRLGLHATPKAIVQALKQQGIGVDEELVWRVQFEMLKATTRAKVAKLSKQLSSPTVRRHPKGFPRR